MSEKIPELAQRLNRDLKEAQNAAFELLSSRGRSAYFPSKGILGQSAEAKGKGINATIGTAFEEDGSPLCLECLEEMISLPDTAFLYAPSYGNPELRAQWRTMMYAKNTGLNGKVFSLPVVTNALTHALSIAGELFVDEGDTLILPDLYWDNYDLIFEHAYGAHLQTFTAFNGECFNVAGMKDMLLAEGEKKILLLNFPNNPAGYTTTEKEDAAIIQAIGEAAQAGKKMVILLDDAYFGLVYEEGISSESLFSRLCDLHPNVLAVKMDGPTKEDYVWGFRVGFITFGIQDATPAQYKALEAKAAGLVRGTISNSSNISQQLLLQAYRHPDYAKQKKAKYELLRSRYQKIKGIFAAHPEFSHSFSAMPFNSGYFMCVKLNGADPETVRQTLLTSFDTGVIVLSGLVRLAYSSVPTDKLETLFTNLHAAVQQVKRDERVTSEGT
ncbi:MAG: aminotransferase class I/II-fold pyridoxal phosphate-dependent enzyme [Kiritimatiellae bacterium]|nr:aminotransferase class I/II-fold pyridoxal phosphate-dependent enzyme [Kiritimatiellia bacterium]